MGHSSPQDRAELLTPDVLQGLVKVASYCLLMRAAKKGKSAFTEKEIRTRAEQAAWSREQSGLGLPQTVHNLVLYG